jgi:putative N6-adenine-specific DNA methylase
MDGRLRFEAQDARHGMPTAASGWIVSNPPYGEQSAPRSASVPDMMRDVAAQLKASFHGWTVWMISSDRDLPRQMRLKESSKKVLFNGPLECRFFCFQMVAGSNRRVRASSDPETAA